MKVTVQHIPDVFQEGSIVCFKEDPIQVYLVTCPASGYVKADENEGTFWAINLTGNRISGGNYRKSLFEKFSGVITIEC